jgi:uncharacterized protein YbjT (DUF2867 family)
VRIAVLGRPDPTLVTSLGAAGHQLVGWDEPGGGPDAVEAALVGAGPAGSRSPEPRRAVAAWLAALKTAGVRRLVYVAELGEEPAEPAAVSPAALAQAAVQASDRDWTVVHLAPLFGPEDRLTRDLARRLRWLPLTLLTGPDRPRLQPLAAAEAAQALVALLESPWAVGGIYELAGPEVLSPAQLLERVLGALGRRRAVIWLPPGLGGRRDRGGGAVGPAWRPDRPGPDRVATDNRLADWLGRPAQACGGAALAYLNQARSQT